MSDLDDLVVTFQTQFSAVMETVLKTAMYEVTRLVEDGFMEEVRHRDRQVESLRTQLEWAASRRTGRCVDCGKADVEVSSEGAEDTPTEYQYSVLSGCGLKQEDDSVERWTRGCGQEVISETTQEADKPTAILSPVKEPEAIEEDGVRPGLSVKEEELLKQSCSVEHSGGWAVSHDGGAESDSCSFIEMTEAAQQINEEFLRTVIKQDLEISATNTFTEDQADTHTQPTHMISEASGFSSVKTDCNRASLTLTTTGPLQNHSLGTRKEGETTTTRPSPKQMSHKLADPITDILRVAQANPPLVRDQSSSSDSPKARPPISEVGSMVIKQEIIVDSDGGEEGEEVGEEKATRPGMAGASCSVNQYRVRPEVVKQKHMSHKPAVQEAMKLHSKVGTSLSLQAAGQNPHQHPHRPIRKLPPTSTSTAPSMPHSQLANFHPFNRTPSISKPTPPPPLSHQRVHHGDKRPVTLSRTSVPWVSIKTHHQAANSHHLHPHPGSNPHPVPKHLLRCGQCGKCFPHPSNLKAHQQTHTGERPFCCSLCGRSFTKLSNLKAHRRVHTGERPYCCSACGKRFTQKCNLKRHQRIHLDV